MSVEVAWAAGFFDGEGCVLYYINQWWRGERLTFGLSASNCDRRALDEMQMLFGGRVRVARHIKGDGKGYAVGIWEVTGQDAVNAARKMLPYCKLKQSQLQLYIDAVEETVSVRGIHITEEQRELRYVYADAIKKLRRPQWEGVG